MRSAWKPCRFPTCQAREDNSSCSSRVFNYLPSFCRLASRSAKPDTSRKCKLLEDWHQVLACFSKKSSGLLVGTSFDSTRATAGLSANSPHGIDNARDAWVGVHEDLARTSGSFLNTTSMVAARKCRIPLCEHVEVRTLGSQAFHLHEGWRYLMMKLGMLRAILKFLMTSSAQKAPRKEWAALTKLALPHSAATTGT